MAVSGEIGLHLNLVNTNPASPLSAPSDAIALTKAWTILNGTGANQADRVYRQRVSIGPSATVSLDLSGSLLDSLNIAFVLVKLKFVIVIASAANNVANNVNVVRPAAGVPLFLAASDGIALAPGDAFMFFTAGAAGKPVTATTADILDLVNSAGTNTVEADVYIGGTSA